METAKNPSGYQGLYDYIGTVGTIASSITVQPSRVVIASGLGTTRSSYGLGQVNLPELEEEIEDIPEDEPDIPSNKLYIHTGSESYLGMDLEIDPMNSEILGIDKLNLRTVKGSLRALDVTKEALRKVSANRSKIGAQQNRLEHTIKNLNNVVENTQAAESAIRDTDMAKEMVALSMHNILEQAGTAMMAQANQSNQSVLGLLG